MISKKRLILYLNQVQKPPFQILNERFLNENLKINALATNPFRDPYPPPKAPLF